MAVGHLTYLDLSPEQRREGAKIQREQLRQLLANPFLTKDQHKALMERVALIDKWEKGDLDVVPPAAKKALPNALKAMPALPPAAETAPALEDVEVSWDEPEVEGDRSTPIVDMSHLAAMLPKETPQRTPVHHEVKLTEEVPVKEELSEAKPSKATKPKAKR